MSASNSAGYTPESGAEVILQRQLFDCVIPYLERTDCHVMAGVVRKLCERHDALAASHGELSQRLKFLDEWLANDDVSSAPMDAKTARLAKAWLRAALAKARPGATP
jgi:hypothetical protein